MQRPEKLDHLTDSTLDYKKTKELYPTTFAQRVDWESVESFEVIEGTIEMMGRETKTDLLFLHSPKHTYEFTPR